MVFRRARIINCKPRADYKLWICFDDGLEGVVDLKSLVGKGVFSAWNSVEFFNTVHIDKISETVIWGEDLDLDPYVLREQVIANQQKHCA